MNSQLHHAIHDLQRLAELRDHQRRALAANMVALAPALSHNDVGELLVALADVPTLDDPVLQAMLVVVLAALGQRARRLAREERPYSLSPAARDAIVKLFNNLRGDASTAWLLPSLLAAARGKPELELLAQFLVDAPPPDSPHLASALGPLFQRHDYDAGALFPRLLDALVHQHLAGVVLDLSNYLTREQRLPAHPAAPRVAQLISLLGALIGRLAKIEETPDAAARTAQQVGDIVQKSLPLAVSLCDALAQIGDPSAIGKLYQALELRHRRLRTEAAAALAKLGEKAGEDALLELAAEPVARLRVLAYAQELNLVDRIDERYSSPSAQAESQLALWLAQPAQFGIPPTSLELIDEREQYWPSFDEPVACFLFRYNYDLGSGVFTNIGIAGPLEHAFNADLADLPPDDIYAAFAGWHAEHEDLHEYDIAALNDSQRVEVARLERRLHDDGAAHIEPQTLAIFFGERVLVALASREGRPGIGIATSSGDTAWIGCGSTSRPLGPHEAYCIFKGRRLLRSFNS